MFIFIYHFRDISNQAPYFLNFEKSSKLSFLETLFHEVIRKINTLNVKRESGWIGCGLLGITLKVKFVEISDGFHGGYNRGQIMTGSFFLAANWRKNPKRISNQMIIEFATQF